MCDVHLDNNHTPLEAKDHLEIVLNSNDYISSSDDDSLHEENIEYVEASPHDSELASPPDPELVSSEVMEIVIPKVGGNDDDILLTIEHDVLHEKLRNVNLLISKIEALKANPTPSSDFAPSYLLSLRTEDIIFDPGICNSHFPKPDISHRCGTTKSSSTSLNSLLEEINTFHNSLPEFENFYFDLGEISSGSTTTHSDISLSEYDSFIFNLTHEEFVDELAHIISPPEYDCFYFWDLPDPGELMSVLNSGIRENISTTLVNLPIEDDYSPLLAYVVWIFVSYLTYPVIPLYLHPFGNEDTIFDPGITINHFYSFKPGSPHRHGAFKKFNTHRNHLNEWPMIINGKNTSILDAKLKKKEWEVKFVESLARFDKWKESSKNLAKLLYSSMSNRTKLSLGFKEYIRSDEVCDLSTPSVFDPEPDNREVKSLYERLVKAGKMHEVPPPIIGTFMPTSYQSDLAETLATFGSMSNSSSIPTSKSNDFVSCDNSDKPQHQKLMTLHPVFQVPRPMTPSLLLMSSKSYLIKDCNVHDTVDNFPSVVLKAASVPAGSKNSSASISAGRFIPAASRNRSASIHAGRSIPTASRNGSTSIHAGRSILAASRNGSTSIHAGRSIPAASRNKPASIHAGKHIPAGRINKPTPFPADSFVPTGWTNPAARPFFRKTKLYFDNVYLHVNKDISIVDSGCPRSMIGNKDMLDDFVQVKGDTVTFGGGDGTKSPTGIGIPAAIGVAAGIKEAAEIEKPAETDVTAGLGSLAEMGAPAETEKVENLKNP
nr:ribonuclease H-like domain, reverse transcriptase, RNA-dependent DNA polymerase [Tanacetum cinerariifolium]